MERDDSHAGICQKKFQAEGIHPAGRAHGVVNQYHLNGAGNLPQRAEKRLAQRFPPPLRGYDDANFRIFQSRRRGVSAVATI